MYNKLGPVIVAEISGNHKGSLERAMELILLAHKNGADAIKIQTYTEDSLTIDCDLDEFQIKSGLWKGYNLYNLYKEAKTPTEWMKPLYDFAKKEGILLFSTPFSKKDVDALEAVDNPIYKIASFEVNDVKLIEECAKTKKPIVMSTGLATLEEIDRAVNIIKKYGNGDLTLLHCESKYPADPKEFNLNTIPFFKQRYGCRVGLSNHALGDVIDIAATAMGADMIEKHFVDDRATNSVDSAFSMNIEELRQLVADTSTVAMSLGSLGVRLTKDDEKNRDGRRSYYLVKDIKKGEALTFSHIKCIRPALGLEPYKVDAVVGKKAKEDIKAPFAIKDTMFE